MTKSMVVKRSRVITLQWYMKPGSRRIFMIPKATSILGKSIIIYYLLRRERDPFVFVFFFSNSFEIFFVVVVRYIYFSPVVSSTTSATAHHEDVSRLTWSRSVHYVDLFSTFFPTTRSSTDRCRTLVAMRHNLRHMRASRRRASRGESLNSVYCAGS